jgi:tRNA-specific 2-thiouridylase
LIALSLFSGGLDSQLATRLLQLQEIEAVAVHFFHRFHQAGEPGSWPDTVGLPRAAATVREAAEQLKIRLVLNDFSDEFLRVANDPRHGRGKGFNPCLDCRIVMLDRARRLMAEYGASFVVTGEVLGQRPMSQHKQGLEMVAKRSGLGRLLLRPLSAQRLPVTIPEEEGWVDRDKLLGLQGRNRKPQIALAKEFGLNDYPAPAGGCFLTDPNLASRFYAWSEHLGALSQREMVALRIGRHFRLPGGTHAVVGRDHHENESLKSLLGDTCHLTVAGIPGAWVYFFNTPTTEDLEVAARLAVRYSDARDRRSVNVAVLGIDPPCTIVADPADDGLLESLRV